MNDTSFSWNSLPLSEQPHLNDATNINCLILFNKIYYVICGFHCGLCYLWFAAWLNCRLALLAILRHKYLVLIYIKTLTILVWVLILSVVCGCCLCYWKNGRAEVSTEDAVSALRRAAKWAQMGLVVSTGSPPGGIVNTATTDKKKTQTEVICREKNAELARYMSTLLRINCLSYHLYAGSIFI